MTLNFRGLHSRFGIVALLAAQMVFIEASVLAQSDDRGPQKPKLRYFQDKPESDTDDMNVRQAESSQSPLVEVPYSRVFKNTDDQIDLFKETHVTSVEPRFGSGGVKVEGGILSGKAGLPFTGKGRFRTEDAEIKISNFYMDIRSISAAMLYSDNVTQNEFHRRSGTLLALRLDFAVLMPLTERLRISAAGAFLYLPLKNRAGFALYDNLKMFEYSPLFRAQIAYDVNVSNWEVEFMDDFRIDQIPFDFQLSYSYFDGAFVEGQREGRYAYGGGAAAGGARVYEDRSPYGRFEPGLVRARNTVGGRASRLLPTETRVEFGAYHSDFWYLNGDHSFLGLPQTGDWAYALAKSERDNMRFKPFAMYRAIRYNYYKDWEHEVKGGVEGPITRNIDFYGAVGQRWLSLNQSETIWDIRVRHQISQYTSHSIEYTQDVTEPDRDLGEHWIYRISQILGDGLLADFYGSYGNFEDLDGNGTSSDEWRAGMRFTYTPSPRTTLQVAGTYTHYDYMRAGGPDNTVWRARFFGSHKLTPTFEAQVQYEFTDRTSLRKGDSYYENFGSVSLIKYF